MQPIRFVARQLSFFVVLFLRLLAFIIPITFTAPSPIIPPAPIIITLSLDISTVIIIVYPEFNVLARHQ